MKITLPEQMQFLSQHLPALQHVSSQMYQTVLDSLHRICLWCWRYNCQNQLQFETVGNTTMGVYHYGRYFPSLCSYCSHSIPSETHISMLAYCIHTLQPNLYKKANILPHSHSCKEHLLTSTCSSFCPHFQFWTHSTNFSETGLRYLAPYMDI
jgi:hypothetical protein